MNRSSLYDLNHQSEHIQGRRREAARLAAVGRKSWRNGEERKQGARQAARWWWRPTAAVGSLDVRRALERGEGWRE